MIALEILKLQLEDFFERSKQQNVTKTIKMEEFHFNKTLFELENHLFKLKQKYNLNQNLNTGISSANILKSFSIESTFFRSNDYSLSFLVFLCMQEKNDAEDLLEMMDKYIDIIKEKLTYHDIVITDSGATRCYTNLRFTLKELRNYGLVYTTTTIGNVYSRSILPTPLGYLISLFVSEPKNFSVTNHLPVRGDSSNVLPHSLSFALKSLKIDMEKFLTNLIEKFDGIRPLKEGLKILIDEYFDNILQFIRFNDDGFIVDEKGLEQSTSTYYKTIVGQVNISLVLRNAFIQALTPNKK
jgi:hypothetical protein